MDCRSEDVKPDKSGCLHGLPSIGEILSLKSHGYFEYSPVDAAAVLFVDGGLSTGDREIFAED
jgi:hypothetical protein